MHNLIINRSRPPAPDMVIKINLRQHIKFNQKFTNGHPQHHDPRPYQWMGKAKFSKITPDTIDKVNTERRIKDPVTESIHTETVINQSINQKRDSCGVDNGN